MNSQSNFNATVVRYGIDALIAVLLFAGSFALYQRMGKDFHQHTRSYRDALLGVDYFAVTRHMCDVKFSPKHHRTTAHPLFGLFFRPVCGLLKNPYHKSDAALMINLIVGCAGNVLFYFCLRKMRLNALLSSAFTGILALGFSHLLYASIPETYIFVFTSLTLLLLLDLSLTKITVFFLPFLAASLFSTGITTTNAVFAAIICFRKVQKQFGFQKAFLSLLVFGVVLGFGLFTLIHLQEKIYPETKDFFASESVASNTKFVFLNIFHSPIETLSRRVPHFFVFNEIAPGIIRNKPMFPGWSELRALTIITMVIYLFVFVLSIAGIVKLKSYRAAAFWPLAAYFIFNICFFLFYGYEPHLYYEHYTFALIALLALPFAEANSLQPLHRHASYVCIILLLPLLAVNNWSFLQMVLTSN